MKKIFSIITIITALFLILSCGANLHNADVMHVDKVVVEGLTDLAGKEMVISGNWIPHKDGTIDADNWAHGMGDTLNILDGAIATVGVDGTVVFDIDVITSVAELEFLGKVNEDAWTNDRFGAKAYTGAGGNVKVANTFTGSDVPKTIHGVVQADESIVWTVVDAIAENRVKIDEIIVVGLPAEYNGKSVEFYGFEGTSAAAPTAVVSGGVVSISFLSPVTLRSDDIEFYLQVVGSTPAMRIASEVDAGAGDLASMPNPKTGERVLKIYGFVDEDDGVTIDWIVRPVIETFITAVEITGVDETVVIDSAATADVYFLNAWLPGNEWNDSTPNRANFTGVSPNRTARRTFASPVKIDGTSISVQIRMMVTPDNFWDGDGNKPNDHGDVSIDTPLLGGTFVFSYHFTDDKVTLIPVP